MGCGCKKNRNAETTVQSVPTVQIRFNENDFTEPISPDLTNVQTTTEDNADLVKSIVDKLNDVNKE